MQVKVAVLTKDKGKTFHYDFFMPLEDAGEPDIKAEGPVQVSISAVYGGREKGITVEGSFQGKARLGCHRCLQEFTLDLSGDFYEEIQMDEAGVCVSEQDFVCSGNFMDLSVLAREHLLLSLPLKVLCREDCQGICPQCGQNLAAKRCDCKDEIIDPRLEKLKELLKD